MTAVKGRVWFVVILVVVVPLVLLAFPSNPPLGKTGAPGEGTCADCHFGGAGGGSVKIKSSTGTTYTPGVKQKLTVTIADPNAVDWGYELVVVAANNTSASVGTLKASNANSSIRKSGSKSYASQVNDQMGVTGSASFPLSWTPPATSVGNVTIYVSSVAGTATGPPGGDSVYNRKLTLTSK